MANARVLRSPNSLIEEYVFNYFILSSDRPSHLVALWHKGLLIGILELNVHPDLNAWVVVKQISPHQFKIVDWTHESDLVVIDECSSNLIFIAT